MPPVQDGLPLTTPTRPLHDLAALLPRHELSRAVEQAQVLKLATREQIAREYRTIRITWSQLTAKSHILTAQLGALLLTDPPSARKPNDRA